LALPVEQFVSPKLVARAIGVSESSIKRWCDQGLLATVRTAGGHRRLPTHAVVEFVRQTGQRFVEPQLVGLPQHSGRDELALDVAVSHLCDALCAGDEVLTRRLLFDLYLARHPLVDLFDSVLTPVMHRIGARWEHSGLEVYQERRACEIVSQVLVELRMALPPAAENAPYAFGGTLSADPYQLATAMVDVSLRDAGWKAESFGSNLPMSTLIAALEHKRPRLCWLSVSHLVDREAFLSEYARFAETAARLETAIVVGGRALTEPLRRQMRYTAFCDTFRHVAELAGAIYKPAPKRFPTATSPTAEPVGELPESL
jgi:MerR family transcriptional regulator, light-induced transcriptional regulator